MSTADQILSSALDGQCAGVMAGWFARLARPGRELIAVENCLKIRHQTTSKRCGGSSVTHAGELAGVLVQTRDLSSDDSRSGKVLLHGRRDSAPHHRVASAVSTAVEN
jgi:hypothetical protein